MKVDWLLECVLNNKFPGNLRVGDRIVSLDGVPVDGLTLSVIHDRLKSAPPGPLKITVSRND